MNIRNNIMKNNSSKLVTLIILGLCLLAPLMAAAQEYITKTADETILRVGIDLRIHKDVDSILVSPESIIKYFLSIRNFGAVDGENVLIIDTLPENTSYVNGSATHNGVYSSASNHLEWNIDMIPAGKAVEITFQVLVDPNTPDGFEINNMAIITSPNSYMSDETRTWVKTGPRPRPEIIKQVDKLSAYPSDTLHYTLTVSNPGDGKAYHTNIVDAIPEFATYIPGSATAGTYDATLKRLDWFVQYMQPGESVTMTFAVIIKADAPAQTEITNIGLILQEIGNVADTVVTTVLAPEPDFIINKKVDKATAFAGDTLTYTLKADNLSDTDNNSTTIIDNIPPYSYFISGSETGGAIYNSSENRIEWTGPIPANGSTGDISFKVLIDRYTPAQTVIMNVGSILIRFDDLADTTWTTIISSPDPRMFIEKRVDKDIAYPGDTLTYDLIVYNSGKATALNVLIEDKIPQHANYVSGSSVDGVYDAGADRLNWTIDEIEPYKDVRLSFVVVIDDRVPGNTTIVNKGTVTSPGRPDSDRTETEVEPYPEPRMYIDKRVDKRTAYPGDTLGYTLVVRNISGVDAEDVHVLDNIPEHTTLIPGSGNIDNYDATLNQVTWDISKMYPNEEVTLYFKVVIDKHLMSPLTIVNIGEVTAPGRPDSDRVSTVVSIHPGPRVYIEKTVDKSSAYNGDTLTYYLNISNYGSESASNVKVTDIIPEHTTYISGSASGATYDATLNQLTWNLSSLYPGYVSAAYLTFDVIIDKSLTAPTTVVNTGVVTFNDQRDTDKASTEVSIHPGPRVYIEKTVDKSSAYNGDTLTYYLDISNYGSEAASNVKVTDIIPEHTTYIPNSAIGGSYDASLNQVTWNIGSLPLGTDVSMFSFKAIIDKSLTAPTTVVNTGVVTFEDQRDTDKASTEVSIHPGPRVYIEKTVDKSSAYNGDTLTYYLDISNYGSEPASNVKVTDIIPEHTTYITGGTYDAVLNQVSWDIASVPQGTDVSMLKFDVVIDKRTPTPTTIVNVGKVAYLDQSDSDEARTDVSAYPEPRLYIEKQVNENSAYPGDTLTYTLIVWNGSEGTAENVDVVDKIPAHMTYVPGTAGGGSYDANKDQLNWTIGSLDSHQERNLRFRAVITAGTAEFTIIKNIGSVIAPGIPDSDEAQTVVLAYPGPELRIEKKVDKATAYAGDTLTYTLIVSNLSATLAENIDVEDYIPAFTSFVPGSAYGGDYDASSELLTWSINYVEAGNPVYLSFKAVIDQSTPDNTDILNTGSIILTTGNKSDKAKTTVIPSPTSELTIIKRVDLATAYAGDTLTYVLSITNIGEVTARNIKLEDSIPDFTAYVLGSASDGDYDATNDILNWSLDKIIPGATVSRSFKAVIDSDTPVQTEIINTGSIILPDGKKSDDAKTTILAVPAPVLEIVKTVDLSTAFAGDTLTYNITVTNTGDANASVVDLEDYIPTYTSYIPGSSTDASYDSGNKRLSWIINNLNAGATSTKTFKVFIDEGTPSQTDIENIGSILLPDESKLSDTAKTIVQNKPTPELEINKTVDLAAAFVGDTLTYMISVANSGETDENDIWITDPIPQNATYIDGSVTGGGDFNPQTATVSWNIAVPANDVSPDLTFKVIINKYTPALTVIRNIGSILYPDETKRSDTVQTIVQAGPSPELDITKTVNRSTAFVGDTLTYTISISNIGEADDDAVWVTDSIPQHVTYVDGSVTNGGIFDSQAGIIDWNVAVAAGGASPDLTFMVIINDATPAQTEIENIGSIIFPDDSRKSDTAKTVVQEIPAPDIEILKQVDSLIASPGSVLTYSLEFTNTGNTAITEITAWDKLPQYTAYVDGSATAGGVYDAAENQINWDWQVGSIAPGHSINLSFEVQIDTDAQLGTLIKNIGAAELPFEQFDYLKIGHAGFSPTHDTVFSNQVTTVVDLKTGVDDLEIFKSVSNIFTSPRNKLTYFLTITNTGEEVLNNIKFADTIPELTTYLPGSASGGATYDGTVGSLTWTIGSMTAGESLDYQFEVLVDADAVDNSIISNQAFIIEPAVLNGNIVTTTVIREVISVVKSVDKTQATVGDTLTYTISYTNNSLADVDKFLIIDTLPVGLNYIPGSASAPGFYNPANHSIAWAMRSSIPAGGSGSVNFQAVIDASVPNQSSIENFVLFSGEDIPIDTSNLVIVTVTFPEMVLSKTVDQPIAVPGDTVTYSILAINDGAGPLNNSVIIDTMPDDFQYISGTATVNGIDVTVTVTDVLSIPVGILEAGASVEIIYDAAILETADRFLLHINSAVLQGTNNSGQPLVSDPVRAEVSLQIPRLSITKRTDVVSSMAGSFVPYTITVTNNANIAVNNVMVIDSMPAGFFYVEGSSIIDGLAAADPVGFNPIVWSVGAIGSGQTITLQYMAQLGTSVPPGRAENIAWAEGHVGGESIRTTNVMARINVITTNIPGAIRGKLIIDCDGDGIADNDFELAGLDLYLDDGSNAQVNANGMFYFGTVRAGEHLVALDIRDLKNYELAEGQAGSVLVFVHEGGESYVTFRICPAFPKLSITKEAALLPVIKVTKTAILSDSMITDSNIIIINYDILIESSSGIESGQVVLVDSFPDETRLIVSQGETKDMTGDDKIMRYPIDFQGKKHLTQTVYYSLDDFDFDSEHFLTNNLYLETVVDVELKKSTQLKSIPVQLSVGPFSSISAGEIEIKSIAAHFVTAMVYLQENDLDPIADLADSISKYPDFKIKVEGHADYRPIHTKRFPSNWELSTERAKSVISRFVKFHGLDSTIFEYEGFAATRPVDRGHTEASWWKNRRAEVILSGSLKGGIEFNGDINQKFSQSTLLELEPIQWDTVIHVSAFTSETETALINTWEVLITINNNGPGKAGQVVINDLLPTGAVYEEGSATVNGRQVSAQLDADNNLTIGSGDIPQDNKIEVRYRIQAEKQSVLTGGGKAVVEIEHNLIGTVKQESNSIRFY